MEQNQSSASDGKTIAIISYLTLIGLIIAFVMNAEKKNSFARYHIVQSLGIMCTGIAIGVISWIPFIGWFAAVAGSILLLVLWVVGLINAVNEREQPVPVLGEHFNKWFADIIK